MISLLFLKIRSLISINLLIFFNVLLWHKQLIKAKHWNVRKGIFFMETNLSDTIFM